jgi:hypothetical protein
LSATVICADSEIPRGYRLEWLREQKSTTYLTEGKFARKPSLANIPQLTAKRTADRDRR